MPWTQFWDMHSGGGTKEPPYGKIYIEAPEDEAAIIFQNRFGHNPKRVSCTCCGDDYILSQSDTLEQATAYHRNLPYIEDERGWLYGDNRPSDYRDGRYLEVGESIPDGYRLSSLSEKMSSYKPAPLTLSEYLAQEHVCVIRADDIKPEERFGALRESGYVWVD